MPEWNCDVCDMVVYAANRTEADAMHDALRKTDHDAVWDEDL